MSLINLPRSTKSPTKDSKQSSLLTLTQALTLAKKLPTNDWRRAEGILDLDINPYKKDEKKEELYDALFLLAEQYNDARDFKKASQAEFKAYQLNPEGYEILHMLERGGCYQPPKTAKEIEEMIIWQNQLKEEYRKLENAKK